MRKSLVLVLISLIFAEAANAQNLLKTPDVSANLLFLYRNSNFANAEESEVRNGPDIQEAEVTFLSDVDPYSRLNIVLALHPEYSYDTAKTRVNQEWVLEPEEAFAETNHVPNTTIRVGKFKAAFGKHNLLHTDVFPFVDAPLIQSQLLGEEGLNDVGLSAAYLIPSSWFSEITVQYFRGEGENNQFHSPSSSDGVGLVHLKNFWDLSDALTAEFGLSHAQGGNYMREKTVLNGIDLTFKWRPVNGGKYHSFITAGEIIQRKMGQPGVADENDFGWNIWARYQLTQRWSTGLRYDDLKTKNADATINSIDSLANGSTKKYSGSLIFNASDFSYYRLEYNHGEGAVATNGDRVEHKIYFQANFTIGSHPAHSY